MALTDGRLGPIRAPPSGMRRDTAMMATLNPEDILGELTVKQREVLDLLIQHKTSKEISRILGISPHTVDQRIMFARSKLNVATRGEVAQAYRRLLEISEDASIYERSIYGHSHVATDASEPHIAGQEDVAVLATGLASGGAGIPYDRGSGSVQQPYYHVLPEMFDGPYGTILRLGYIAVITVFMIVAVLGGLSMYAQLASIVDY